MGHGMQRADCAIERPPRNPTPIRPLETPPVPATEPAAGRPPRREVSDALADDVMALYLSEISRIPLLSTKDERCLARSIQRGRLAQRRLERASGLDGADRARLERLIAVGERSRQRLISANFRLVVSVAKRYAGMGVSLPDLIQEGNIGLIRAVEKFDHRRGFKLSTYATWWIRQAITRALAEQGRMIRLPVHTCERLSQVTRAVRALTQELGRDPEVAEVAARVELTPEQVEFILGQAQQPLSLDMPVGEDREGRLGDFVEDEGAQVPSDATWRTLLRHDMQQVRGCLSAREDRVLEMRYGLRDGHAYTLDEVGSHFGLTRERIRQIEAQALGKLRQPIRSERLRDYLG